MAVQNLTASVINKQYMWKFKTAILLISWSFFISFGSYAQNSEDEETVEVKRQEILTLGLTFDYLKLHTLLLDDREKWEFAVNLAILDKISAIAELGRANLNPVDAIKNANYTSEGNYGRFGLDYITKVNPDNKFIFGLRYSMSEYNEKIAYQVNNPLFENQIGLIERNNYTASWFELVISSEKIVRNIFKKPITDFLALGFKARVKANLEYTKSDFANSQQIPGYGLTNNKINPEINLYIKIRLGLLSKSTQ